MHPFLLWRKMGHVAISISDCTDGYHGRTLFKDANLEISEGNALQ